MNVIEELTKTPKTATVALLAACSGFLIAISLPGFNIFPAAMAGIALIFFVLSDASLARSVLYTSIAGLTTGLIYFTWSLQSSYRYTGSMTGESVLVYLSLTLYHIFWYALFGAGYYYLKRTINASFVAAILSTASLWVLWEWSYQNALPSFPWVIGLSSTQWNNLFLLQWASIGGVWAISFIVAAFGAALSYAAVHKNKNIAMATVAVFGLVHLAGYALYRSSQNGGESSVRVSILQENISAEERWDYAYVDSLAHIFIDLNTEAVNQQSQIIAWSETAIPWTFRTDDALLNKTLTITSVGGASHLLGMLTQADDKGDVFNSVYCLRPDGAVTGRYDKRELLAFLERPLVSSTWELPFTQSRYKNIVAGTRPNLLGTEFGTLGVMICNESLHSASSLEAVRNGARMLFVASNDSWFYGSVLDEAHIALTRFRAVETRRDILVDANRGYAGVIRASGRLDVVAPSARARSIPVSLSTHGGLTSYAEFPGGFLYGAILILLSTILQRITKLRRAR